MRDLLALRGTPPDQVHWGSSSQRHKPATGRRAAASRRVQTAAGFGRRGGRGWWRAFEEQPHPDDETVITILGADGTVTHIPSLPHKLQQLERLSLRKARSPLPTPAEQGLCLGSLFTIQATNGYDVTRRVNYFGFCQSTEFLLERVEDAVVSRGGEVFETDVQLKSGMQECLHMTVAVPLLWGVPPEVERLELGIKSGGGIIHKRHQEWHIY